MLDIGTPTLSQLAKTLATNYNGDDVAFAGVSIDSRTIKNRELFVAIKGPNFDGHNYLKAAMDNGAVAAIVSEVTDARLPNIRVYDTKAALIRMATVWREAFNSKVAGITGSNGKTTVKEMLSGILGTIGPGLKTYGNLNNDFGVPLTLLRLKPEHQWAVIEMGANAPGEIGFLANIARPFVALVNNVSMAHVGGFGSVADTAFTKGEIYKYLPEDGVAVMPYASEFRNLWQKQSASNNIVTFGREAAADIQVISKGDVVELQTPKGVIELSLSLGGEHNHLNAAAATAIALQFGVELENIKQGLSDVQPVAGRLNVHKHGSGAIVIDDTYNANPVSVKAAIKYLAGFTGNKILVLGDMTELGADENKYHQEVGTFATGKIDKLVTLGELTRHTQEKFNGDSRHFDDMQSLIEFVKTKLDSNTRVLVKGSRLMQMQRLVEALLEKDT